MFKSQPVGHSVLKFYIISLLHSSVSYKYLGQLLTGGYNKIISPPSPPSPPTPATVVRGLPGGGDVSSSRSDWLRCLTAAKVETSEKQARFTAAPEQTHKQAP